MHILYCHFSNQSISCCKFSLTKKHSILSFIPLVTRFVSKLCCLLSLSLLFFKMFYLFLHHSSIVFMSTSIQDFCVDELCLQEPCHATDSSYLVSTTQKYNNKYNYVDSSIKIRVVYFLLLSLVRPIKNEVIENSKKSKIVIAMIITK